ncbi:MAG: PilN domain-containing protein [Yokenella regensburgei]|jgi:pilus assembly protein HofN|uniref:PilN domain-containing protein n=1 Tax=Yokenella regensburgei TaxID=158877 RepID=UPI0020778A2D|nr:PilN domain-containing protein [Yokenella regensburgei]MDR3103463.1 PilN domain-containing protein [Yokenella regensburgei]
MAVVNFLPWRENQRQQCLRLWGLLFGGTVLVTILLWFALGVEQRTLLAVTHVHKASQALLTKALTQREAELRLGLKKQEVHQRLQWRREQTRAWQQRFSVIAERCPQPVWLTEIDWQKGRLILDGFSVSFPALASLTSALRDIPGLSAATMGKTHRDNTRWQFRLHMEGKDESSH